ncbi:MAG: hypothetical protein KUG67_03090 [Proteobacteria bacterium]|nr:hypothetical protein [Pseudomonadota bacterium]
MTLLIVDDTGAAFAQPWISNSFLEGDGTTSGFGMALSTTAATVDNCEVKGDLRGIYAAANGITTVLDSKIHTLGLNAIYEQTGSATILSGGCFFVGGDTIGLASRFKFAHCIKPNFDIVEDGFGSDI